MCEHTFGENKATNEQPVRDSTVALRLVLYLSQNSQHAILLHLLHYNTGNMRYDTVVLGTIYRMLVCADRYLHNQRNKSANPSDMYALCMNWCWCAALATEQPSAPVLNNSLGLFVNLCGLSSRVCHTYVPHVV